MNDTKFDSRTQDSLRHDWPILFRNGTRFIEYHLPYGWIGLVERLSGKLEKLACTQDTETKVSVCQVKAKLGGLRYYADNTTPEMNVLIDEAENRSLKICERCGADGTRSSYAGWIRTLCDPCKKID